MKRKLKKPQIRRWSEHKEHGWGFDISYGSKARLSLLADLTKTARQDGSFKKEEDYVMGVPKGGGRRVHWNVAYKGKEFAPDEFMEKYPIFYCDYTWGGKGTKPKCAEGSKKMKGSEKGFGRNDSLSEGFSIFSGV